MVSIIPGNTFPVNTTFGPYLRMKMSAGVLALAGAAEDDIGTLEQRVISTDTAAAVASPQSPLPVLMIANGVIAQYAAIYAAASGKIGDSGSKFLGIALEASAADGDAIQVWRMAPSGAVSDASETSATSFLIGSGIATAKLKLDTNSATGNFTMTLVPANLSSDVTVTLPAGNLTLASRTGTETLTNKTLTAPTITTPTFSGNQTVAAGASTAAAGTVTGNATALPAGTALVYPTTAADDTKGVVISATDKVTGRMLFIGNGVSNKILKVYPPSGGTINGASADAAFSSASGKGVIIYCLDATANSWLAW